jgi:hypothetical protein
MKLGWIILLEFKPESCPQRAPCCVGHCEYGLGDQQIRITPDLQESGEQPGGQAKLDALAMIVHSWTIFAPPS